MQPIDRLILLAGLSILWICHISEATAAIPRSYIVEYTDLNHHQSIKDDLSSYNDFYQVHHTYSSPIFQGMSFTLKDHQKSSGFPAPVSYSATDDIHPVYNKLQNHPSIKRIFPIYEVPRPQWNTDNQNITFPYSNQDTEIFSIHEKLGITGEGVLVGVLDSGIDYRHPALGNGFGKGHKVRLGKNLVPAKDDEKFGIDPLGEDDPFDPCLNVDAGHGTHVSGIIAGYDPEKNFTGIAPNASLAMFRIFGCSGGAGEDTVIKAMLMAYEAGCKIINLSLGIENSWPEDAMSVVAERLSNEGVIVVGVAGNQGSDGIYSQNSPGTGRNVMSVASVDNSFYLSYIMNVNVIPHEYFPFVLSSSSESFPNGTIAKILDKGAVPFACKEDPTITPERASGKILLVQRGLCTFDEKLEYAKSVGSIGILFYDPDTTQKSVVVARTKANSLPCAGIDLKLALTISEFLKNETETAIEITLPKQQEVIFTETAGKISGFSSTGPTYELDLKPSITGIGGEVFSTLPLHVNHGWGVRSGTSMASPHVAGTTALVLEYYLKQNINVTSTYIIEHLQNHAKIVQSEGSKIEHPLIQGAGLIQPFTSIKSKIHVSPSQISFNDTASLTQYKTQTLKIENLHPYPVRVQVRNLQSQSIQSYPDNDSFTPTEPVIKNGTIIVDLEYSSSIITLPSSSVTSIEVKVVLPDPKEIKYHYQMYGGFIVLEEFKTNSNLASVPYFGVLGRMIDIPVFDKQYPYLAPKKNSTARPSDPSLLYRFDLQRKVSTKPAIVTRLLSGSANIEITVYDENNKYVGIMSGGPWIYNQRNKLTKENYISTIAWDGKVLAQSSETAEDSDVMNGQPTQVPDGVYFLRLRALKHFGDPTNNDDWEEWMSGPINIQS